MADTKLRLTYATMFSPPEELHERFDEALVKVRADLGKEYGMIIDGKDYFTEHKMLDVSPADTGQALGVFQKGKAEDARVALADARRKFSGWSRTPWQERVRLLRKVAGLVDQRTFEIAVAMAMSVGKNRIEAVGEVAETADLISYCCDEMERNRGFITQMGQDPIEGHVSTNLSVLRPYGVWVVISPFNFPTALTGGPAAAALATGNTVVFKPSSDTPWPVRLLADCFRDAGVPDGVFNCVTGSGDSLGRELIMSSEVDGITFTGSYEVGMHIYRERAKGDYVRPLILEMGGKNPTIVSRNARLDRAAVGIMRSAFGLQGQKCSACSRVFVEESAYHELVSRLVDETSQVVVGDPTSRKTYMGPVINRKAYEAFERYVEELSRVGVMLSGGKVLTEGKCGKGFFCAPTVVGDVPLDHPLWMHEMFLPIVMVAKVKDLSEAIQYANDTPYGLTAGFYGSEDEVRWFFDNIQVGVAYANRPVGATTGAWPGFQPFGGWKGSGASGKNSGGRHYLQLYTREQIQNQFL